MAAEGQFGRECRRGINPYAGLCSLSCCRTSNIISPVNTHQPAAPPSQTAYRNSISNIWDWEVPLCIVLSETTVCGYYHGNCRELSKLLSKSQDIEKYETSTAFVVEACGLRLSTTKSLFWARHPHEKQNYCTRVLGVFLRLYNKCVFKKRTVRATVVSWYASYEMFFLPWSCCVFQWTKL